MAVDTLTSRDLFRLTLASPADVEPNSGEIELTSENLIGGASPSFTNLAATGTLTVGGASTLTGVVTTGGAVTVGTNLTAANGTAAVRALTVAQTADVTGNATVGGSLTVTGASAAASYSANAITSFSTFSAGASAELTVSAGGFIAAILPTYADNAAALLGGLVVTNVYKTATGEVRIVV